jgi:hypothetical protein
VFVWVLFDGYNLKRKMAGNEHLKTRQSGHISGVLDGDIGSSSAG